MILTFFSQINRILIVKSVTLSGRLRNSQDYEISIFKICPRKKVGCFEAQT